MLCVTMQAEHNAAHPDQGDVVLSLLLPLLAVLYGPAAAPDVIRERQLAHHGRRSVANERLEPRREKHTLEALELAQV